MENLDLVYSLFNQFVFQDAKNNLESLEYYFNTNPNTSNNTLVKGLLKVIRDYSFETIDIPILQSVLNRDRKNPEEQRLILDNIMRWKNYDKTQMGPTKNYIRDICAGVMIQRANNKYADSPYEFWRYLKNSDLKIDNSDMLSSMNFSDIDINTIMAENGTTGYPSSFPWVNSLFVPYGQYESGQMVMITMPPGCMTGETEVILPDGRLVTLAELHESGETNIEVYSVDENGNVVIDVAECCQISKIVTEVVLLKIGDREFRVTKDHPFLTTQGWIRADKIKYETEILLYEGNNLVKATIKPGIVGTHYNDVTKFAVYDLVNVKKNHNYLVSIDGTRERGIFSHNTGKTLWMMTEALHMALTTKARIHYLAMGDMKPRDFIIRMGSIYSGKPFGEVTKNVVGVYNTLKQFMQDRLEMSVIPAGTITADEYVEYVMSKDYDIVFVDYDSNFRLKESESMYNDFGIVYNNLTKLTQAGKLVFVAAQPKIYSWVNPVIELGDVGESARKIHTADVLFTAGKCVNTPNHVGIFKCCKNRRGEEGGKIGYIRLNNGRFKFIPINLAEQLGEEREKREYTEAEIDAMVQRYQQHMSSLTSVQASGPQKVNNPFKK